MYQNPHFDFWLLWLFGFVNAGHLSLKTISKANVQEKTVKMFKLCCELLKFNIQVNKSNKFIHVDLCPTAYTVMHAFVC